MITSLFQRVPNVIQVRGSLDIGGPRGVEFLPSAEVLPRSVCCADFLGSCLFEQVHSWSSSVDFLKWAWGVETYISLVFLVCDFDWCSLPYSRQFKRFLGPLNRSRWDVCCIERTVVAENSDRCVDRFVSTQRHLPPGDCFCFYRNNDLFASASCLGVYMWCFTFYISTWTCAMLCACEFRSQWRKTRNNMLYSIVWIYMALIYNNTCIRF